MLAFLRVIQADICIWNSSEMAFEVSDEWARAKLLQKFPKLNGFGIKTF